jgi:hypothetical protein
MAQSSDPDADAVMAGFDHPEAAHDSDAAAVLASFDAPPTPKSDSEVVKDLIHAKVTKGIASIGGGLREIGDLATGTSIADADNRYQQYVKEHSFQPTDPTSQALIKINQKAESSPLNPTTWPGRAVDMGSDMINNLTGSTAAGPIMGGMGQGLLGVMGIRSGVPGAVGVEGAQAAINTAASKQSMGAAGAAPRLETLSPELQAGVRKAVQQTGGAVAPDVLTRHVEADSLPVKVQLTEGQATQNPQIISQEMNTRGRTPQMVERLSQQNKQLGDNLQALRDREGPEVFSTNEVEHGDTLIGAYKAKAATAEADIGAKYQALRDANGGQFPVDPKQLYDNAAAQLHDKLLFEHAPKELTQLESLASKGNMSFEQFEALRTNLARTMRSSSNGNEVAAAGVIRQAMEDLPLTGGAANLKPLADAARSAARTQFQAVDADPAYSAAISGKVPPDQFVRKFVTGPSATRDGVAQMRNMIGDDETARQTLAVAALDHLRKSAGIDAMGNGNFTQAGFNKALGALDPKLKSLVNPKTAEQLSTLGNVARYTQAQPRGSYVNNSNTFVAGLGEQAKGIAEGAANKILGVGVVPVGTMVREAAQKRAAAQATARSLEPGAGLTRLSDVANK